MRKCFSALLLTSLAAFAVAAAEQSSVTLDGKTIAVKNAVPAAKAKISAAFHTDADLVFKGLALPKGDYTVSVVEAAGGWQLDFGKLGRVAMNVSKAAAPAAAPRLTLTRTAALAARLEIAVDSTVAAAPFKLDRVAGDSEW